MNVFGGVMKLLYPVGSYKTPRVKISKELHTLKKGKFYCMLIKTKNIMQTLGNMLTLR